MDQSPKLVPAKEAANGAVVAALVVLVLLGAVYAYWSTARMLVTLQSVDHTVKVRLELQHLLSGIIDAETAQRGYLLSGRDDFLAAMPSGLDAAKKSLDALEVLTEDNAHQQSRLKMLRPLLDQKVPRMEEQVRTREQDGLAPSAALVGTPEGRKEMEDLRAIIEQMEAEESRLLTERSQAAQWASRNTLVVVSAGSLAIIALVGWAAWSTRRELAARRRTVELQESARQYAESIVETVRVPLLVLDQGLRVERANRSYYDCYGANPAETEDRLVSELGQGQWNRPQLAAMLTETLTRGEKFDNLEWEQELAGGKRRTVLFSGSKLWRPGNHTEAVLLAIEDVTERRRAEEALRASEERFRMIVEAVEDYAIFMLDTEGRVASWNPGAERLKGYKAEEILGRHFSCFYPPEDISAGKPDRELAEAREKGRMEDENWRVRRDGTRFFANVILSPIRDGSGQLRGYAKVTRDVSERHRLEEMHVHFRELFNSLPGLYLVLTPKFIIAAVSDAYLKATMTRREDIVGHNLFEIFPDNPNDPGASGQANLSASLQRVLKTGRTDTMPIQKYDVRRPDGVFEERYWSPVNSPLLGADQSIEYIIHRVEDVTDFVRQKEQGSSDQGDLSARLERMEAEMFRSSQAVQATNHQLRAANAELEAFSYSVSHDLRAPLRHIDGFSDLLTNHAGASLDEKGRRYLKTISDSAKRMGALIDDLLVFSRIGRSEMRRTRVDLNPLADEVINELRVETNGRNVVWSRQGLPVVEGDPSLLRQVFVNLFSNAVKYTRPRDPAVIEIGYVHSNDEDTIFVRDNGVGFDMTYVAKLFGVFQRLHRNDEFEGTGIGLANVHRIVQRHGGRTWAEGKPGVGAAFFFTLPIGAPSLSSERSPTNSNISST